MIPHDTDREARYIADLIDPLAGSRRDVVEIEQIDPAVFYRPDHRRIVHALREYVQLQHRRPGRASLHELRLDPADLAYVRDLVAYAWPLCRGDRARLADLAWRRQRLAELEEERFALLETS